MTHQVGQVGSVTSGDAAFPAINGRPVKLIASDIDGTILPYRFSLTGTLSPRTVEAFRAAQAAGIHILLVTGRPIRGLRRISESIGSMGPVVASNGAVTYDLAKDHVVQSSTLELSTLLRVKELITQLDPQANFAAETFELLHLEEAFAHGSLWFEPERRKAAGIQDEDLLIGPLDATLASRRSLGQVRRDRIGGDRGDRGRVNRGGEPGPAQADVLKLLAKTSAFAPDDFLAQAQASIGDLVTVTHSAPGISLLEISALGVNKAQALKRYARSLGIAAEETVAFGDMPNDIDMLQWAGTSWAVRSAHPLARDAATHLARECEEDGVAVIIEQLLQDHWA